MFRRIGIRILQGNLSVFIPQIQYDGLTPGIIFKGFFKEPLFTARIDNGTGFEPVAREL